MSVLMPVGDWTATATSTMNVSTKARQFSLKSKTMLFDLKCSIFDATSMFRNLEFSKIIIDFNENIRFS